LSVPVGAGERPFTEPAAAVRRKQRDRRAIDLLLGKPPEDKLDGGEADDGGQVFRVLKSLARCRLRPNQEKVRSTTTLGQQPKQRRHIASLRRALTLRTEGLRGARIAQKGVV